MSLKERPDLLKEQIDEIVLVLKVRREERQLSKTELADLIGRSVPTITKIEGRHVGLSLETLLLLCDALGLRLTLESEEDVAVRNRFDAELPRLLDVYLRLDEFDRGRLLGQALEMYNNTEERGR